MYWSSLKILNRYNKRKQAVEASIGAFWKPSRSLNTHEFDNGQGTAGLQRVDEPGAPPPSQSEDSLPRLAELTATKADAPRMR